MVELLRGLCLAPVLLLGLVVATSPAKGAGGEEADAPTGGSMRPVRMDTGSDPPAVPPADASEGRSDEVEGLPGRDDPEEFYKKPPRKPKLRTKMHA